MEKVLSATEAVRDFSQLLNRIKFKGESFIIRRGGKPVACMGPVGEFTRTRRLKELKQFLKELPRLGDEVDAFAADLDELTNRQPSLPERDPWA